MEVLVIFPTVGSGTSPSRAPAKIIPAELVLDPPKEGVAKLVWFKILKNSARNSSFPLSPKKRRGVSLVNEKSRLANPGPRRILRPAEPKNPADCSVNAQGSNHRFVGVP